MRTHSLYSIIIFKLPGGVLPFICYASKKFTVGLTDLLPQPCLPHQPEQTRRATYQCVSATALTRRDSKDSAISSASACTAALSTSRWAKARKPITSACRRRPSRTGSSSRLHSPASCAATKRAIKYVSIAANNASALSQALFSRGPNSNRLLPAYKHGWAGSDHAARQARA